ncbi:MAG: alpha/beta fold hydrolase [Planctomycetes bacterium]|nr:alpha/beta fold hydrolase [Planctomycetota bacterium]
MTPGGLTKLIEFLILNWALISIAATLVLLVVVPALILRKYVRIALHIVKDTIPALSMVPRDFVRLEGDIVEFRAFDGLRLNGMFLYGDARHRPRGMVIFAHEFKSDMYSASRYCQGLLAAGYDVFSFDFRNHGASTCEENYRPLQWCTDRELDDILGAVAFVEDWLERQQRPPEIGLFGVSRGGAACLLAARRNPTINAIITDGAFSSDKVIEYFMKRWASVFAKIRFVYENHPPTFWRFLRWLLYRECHRKLGIRIPSARKALMHMEPRPILLIHGEEDTYIPVDQSRILYAAASDPRYMWIVPGAKHNQSAIVAPQEYAKRTASFFDRYLTDSAPSSPSESLSSLDSQSVAAVESPPKESSQRGIPTRLRMK